MMFASPKKFPWATHSIFRILSDDLPPRDEIGSRLKVLDFILNNEPEFEDTTKGWVLNSFINRDNRQKLIDMLIKYNHYVVVFPWARNQYNLAKNREEKLIAAININKVRNLAVDNGKLISRFTTVLDGDCYFTLNQWNDVRKQIEIDQKFSPHKYYSIPCSRSTFEHALSSDKCYQLAEPMTVFRNDAKLRFDENIPFGNGDKLKFLYNLNHRQEQGRHHELINEDYCKCFGMVHHLSGSDYEIEKNLKLRIELRNKSLNDLISRLDNYQIPSRKPNEYWKSIQGYFDFQGLYSHFAFDHNDGSKFVEVGSWKGASTCYWATEIKNRNKKIDLYAVDTWMGSDEYEHAEQIEKIGGTERLYELFLNHIKKAGVSDIVKPLKMNSLDASKKFENNSLDVVFIDASHKYEDVLADISAWYPKVKIGGKIAGHDFLPNHPISEVGVIRAVLEYFKGKNLEISPAGRTWLHHKS